MFGAIHHKLKLTAIILVLTLLSFSPAMDAYAATITWTTTGSDSTPLTKNPGNQKTFTTSGNTLTVAAFAISTASGALQTATVGAYSPGLGVTNSIQSGSNETTSPEHTLDNVGAIDLLIYEFASDKYSPLSAVLKQFGDTDVTYFVGGKLSDFLSGSNPFGGFAGKTLAQLTGTYGFSQHDSLGSSTDRTLNFTPGESGRYLIIAANLTNADGIADQVKIASLTGQPVPEPSTFVLIGTGLLGLAAWRGRKTERNRRSSRGSRRSRNRYRVTHNPFA